MAVSNDPFHLQRFVDAQDENYEQICIELRSGRKTGHWIWFIFPQLRGLGSSPMASRFGISARQEAEAYLKHPVLAARLEECARLVTSLEGRPIEQILGGIDAMKFKSSMTLFANVAPENRIFKGALEKYFGGELDPLTVERLDASAH